MTMLDLPSFVAFVTGFVEPNLLTLMDAKVRRTGSRGKHMHGNDKISAFVQGVAEQDQKVVRDLLTVSTVRVPCSTMPNAQLEIPEEIKQRYEQIADTLNAARTKSGQKPITGSTVMQVVLARFAGLPVDDNVNLDAVANTGTQGFMWTPPHGG